MNRSGRRGRVGSRRGVRLLGPLAAIVAGAHLLGPATSAADSCPNTALRTGPSANLADCRAYELVTPAFKYGSFPQAATVEFLDESHLKTASVGGFAEAGANQSVSGSDYVIGRSETSGWASTGVDLPASQFGAPYGFLSGEQVADVSSDFSKTLIANRSLDARIVDLRFYLREAQGAGDSCPPGAIRLQTGPAGCALEVGPAVPPDVVSSWEEVSFNKNATVPVDTRYRGASRDLSHVVFESQVSKAQGGAFWPGDESRPEPGVTSLYEYTGVGNAAPRLVGVEDAGKVISQCGTALGNPQLATRENYSYNAVSATGRTIFFTAVAAHGGAKGNGPCEGVAPSVNELYARAGGSKTVAVSEPSLATPGRECTGACREAQEQPSKRAEGTFQGASSDGATVFFLTKQPLIDADEGGSGSGLDLYEARIEGEGAAAKVAGLAQVSHDTNVGESAEVQGVVANSADGARVYFVARGVLSANLDARGEKAVAGADNLYVSELDASTPGQLKTTFVATLSEQDVNDWTTPGRRAEVTPDGRFLLITSTNDLTPDAAGPTAQLYRYDTQSASLIRVSRGENGLHDNETCAAGLFCFPIHITSHAGEGMWAGPEGVSISDDGAFVFFESEIGLTPQALNKQQVGCALEEGGECLEELFANNIYEYHDGRVRLISDGQDRHATLGGSQVKLVGASPSGHDVFFRTADPLVPQDTDTQVDIYDARMFGGVAPPPPTASCEGDACHGSLAGPPSLLSPGTSSFSGPGNATPAVTALARAPKHPTLAQQLAKALRACKKKPRRLRARCVRRAKRAYAVALKRARHSSHDRGGR